MSNLNSNCVIISVEGADGIGKSTQVQRVVESLRASGHRVATAKLPTPETMIGKIIRWMMRTERAIALPNVFQTLQWIDKFVFQTFILKRLIRDNDYVVLDRWHASTWAYGLSSGANEWFTNLLVNSLFEPHLVFILHGTCKRVDALDAYEKNVILQKSVKLHYILWACTHAHNVRTISTDDTLDNITRDIMDQLLSIA